MRSPDVVEAISIHIGDHNRAALAVMPHSHVLGHVVDRVVDEGYSALLELIYKLELINLKTVWRPPYGPSGGKKGSPFLYRSPGNELAPLSQPWRRPG